ncbi:autophagy protein, partial [Coemansia sp. RSA 2607]
MAPYFDPPMWEQRRICISSLLYEQKVHSVLEVGCGEGNILMYLTAPTADDENPITHLYGIDINADSLKKAELHMQPSPRDFSDLRVDELHISLFHGDATGPPIPEIAPDAIVCSEVIEHLQPSLVGSMTGAVLGGYRPRVAVFTTPNAEFNVNFPALGYGTEKAQFRDEDHKFEWTRAEFVNWANESAARYGYKVTFHDIGTWMCGADDSFVKCGGCTQMALFVRDDSVEVVDVVPQSDLPVPRLFATIDHPFYDKPRLPEDEVLQLVRKMAGYAIEYDDVFYLDMLWNMMEVRYQFKRRRILKEWLNTKVEDFMFFQCGEDGLDEDNRADSDLLFINFNQDFSCLSVGTKNGYKIYNCEPFGKCYARSEGGIGTVEMLFCTSLVALVGSGDQPTLSPRRLQIINTKRQSIICELTFPTTILAVKLNRRRLIAVLEEHIYVYDISNMKLLHTIETPPNPTGICAMSPSSDNCFIAYPTPASVSVPSSKPGASPEIPATTDVMIFDANTCEAINIIQAHKTPVSCLAINRDGTLLATASDKGTVIRVFSLPSAQKIAQFRRGAYPAKIHSITFNATSSLLMVSSDTDTVHIFRVADGQKRSKGSSGSSANNGGSLHPSDSFASSINSFGDSDSVVDSYS